MHEARKICNFLLAHYDARKFDLTNLRLNKLLYFVHGWSLTRDQQGLIRNHFEAWQLGPVIRPVYDTFKAYGDGQTSDLAEYLDYATGQRAIISYDDITASEADMIIRVFDNYAPYTTNQLVALSHEPGGPWDLVYKAWSKDKRLSPRIPNDLIRSHFLKEAGGKTRH